MGLQCENINYQLNLMRHRCEKLLFVVAFPVDQIQSFNQGNSRNLLLVFGLLNLVHGRSPQFPTF